MTREMSEQELRALADGELIEEDSELWLQLKRAARGEIDATEVGRSRKLMVAEEPIADAIRRVEGLGPTVVRREKQVSVLVHIMPSSREALRTMAEGYGFLYNGRGNVSMLLDAIGQGKLQVVRHTEDS